MNWDKLLSSKRFGLEDYMYSIDHSRSQFQRDYDRIIFSSPFRRLQNKTQVFPLPGSVFVHNRLTHSLEVASIGRSLGNIVSNNLLLTKKLQDNPLISEIGSIVSAACLAHDMGNPPFGHSGEEAISIYFRKNESYLKTLVSKEEWLDLVYFEGNANALRILTHQFKGRREGGFALTYSTIAAMIKYPFGSDAKSGKNKYGFFNGEKGTFLKVAKELELICTQDDPLKYARHPLVHLVEAADDICYNIMDLEDAHKLNIITLEETKQYFLNFYDKDKNKKELNRIYSTFKDVTDANEQIAYLRAGVISILIRECSDAFLDNYDLILSGRFEGNLIDHVSGVSKNAIDEIKDTSIKRIYNHPSVVKIEIGGYKILYTLLNEFVPAVLDKTTAYSKKTLSLLPDQFKVQEKDNYKQILSVIDFISGMTDLYALDLYRIIEGMDFPKI